MENFNSKKYRDNLAEKLTTVRNMGDAGKEAAKTMLQHEQQTEIYKEAHDAHREVEQQKMHIQKLEKELSENGEPLPHVELHKVKEWEVFDTVKLNNEMTSLEYLRWLHQISPEKYKEFSEIIKDLGSPESLTEELVQVRIEDLGLDRKNVTNFAEILEVAEQQGLVPCSKHTGLQYYLERVHEELPYMTFISDSVARFNDNDAVFRVGTDPDNHKSWLSMEFLRDALSNVLVFKKATE